MSIKWVGAPELNAKLKRMVREFPRERDLFLRQEAQALRTRVVKKTPVDTGYLKNSWEVGEPSGGSIEVFNDVEYSGYVEFGHRIVAWGHDTGRIQPGVFMLTDSIDEARAQFNIDAQRILDRLFR